MSPRFRSMPWLLAAIAAAILTGSLAIGDATRASTRAAYASPLALSPTPADSAFARLVQRLSEPGGYFDSDNLISNETSYLHVLDGMRRLKVQGGAYIGVGPDQNFSYIARIRPTTAYIIDIRRDNLLLHLLFKALFARSTTRGGQSASKASCQRGAHRHQRSPAFSPANPNCGAGVERSFPRDFEKRKNSSVTTTQTVWLPASSGPVSQQALR